MEKERTMRITIPKSTIVRLQKWLDSKNSEKRIVIKRGQLAWNEIAPSQVINELLKEVKF